MISIGETVGKQKYVYRQVVAGQVVGLINNIGVDSTTDAASSDAVSIKKLPGNGQLFLKVIVSRYFFLVAAFLTATFLVAVFFVAAFLVAVFFGAAVVAAFLAGAAFSAAFLATGFFAAAFLNGAGAAAFLPKRPQRPRAGVSGVLAASSTISSNVYDFGSRSFAMRRFLPL